LQPQFVLDVEVHELGINAGLQDRVIQKYKGLVFMDFGKEIMDAQGHGNYISMNARAVSQVVRQP
jgi:glucuronokinase